MYTEEKRRIEDEPKHIHHGEYKAKADSSIVKLATGKVKRVEIRDHRVSNHNWYWYVAYIVKEIKEQYGLKTQHELDCNTWIITLIEE